MLRNMGLFGAKQWRSEQARLAREQADASRMLDEQRIELDGLREAADRRWEEVAGRLERLADEVGRLQARIEDLEVRAGRDHLRRDDDVVTLKRLERRMELGQLEVEKIAGALMEQIVSLRR